MGQRIESSIKDLGGQVTQMTSILDKSLQDVEAQLTNVNANLRDEAKATSKRHSEILKQFENMGNLGF